MVEVEGDLVEGDSMFGSGAGGTTASRGFGEGVKVPPNRPDRSTNQYYGSFVDQPSQVSHR